MRKLSSILIIGILIISPVVIFTEVQAGAKRDVIVVKKVEIKGLKKLNLDTVRSQLRVKDNSRVSSGQIQDEVKRIYKTGFFKDIRVNFDKGVLVFDFVENYIVNQISVEGSVVIPRNKILEVLNKSGIVPSRFLDENVLYSVVQSLRKNYRDLGYYAADVSYSIVDRDGLADVKIDVVQNDKTKVKNIRFKGNRAFGRSELLKQLPIQESSIVFFLSSKDIYSQIRLDESVEALRKFYLDKGYLDFDVVSTDVILSGDKKSVDVEYLVYEGLVYTFGEKSVTGDFKIEQSRIYDAINKFVRRGETFSQTAVSGAIQEIRKELSSRGYASPRINPIPSSNRDDDPTVNINFIVDAGYRNYVDRIYIQGNAVTRDEVIRRELRQLEGAWFDSELINRSQERLQLLGYLDKVSIVPEPVDGSNRVNLRVNVEEIPSSSIELVLGYTPGSGIFIQGGVSQQNFFGTGNSLTVNLSKSNANVGVDFGIRDPYFWDNGVSLGFNLSARRSQPYKLNRGNYSSNIYRAYLSSTIPISEYDSFSVSFGPKVEEFFNREAKGVVTRYSEFNRVFGSRVRDYVATVFWDKDMRDSAIWPTKGFQTESGLEFSLPMSSVRYYQFTHSQNWYFPMSENFTLSLNGRFDVVNSYSDSEDRGLPFYQHLYLGGIGSVRGYVPDGIGLRDQHGYYLGGTKRLSASVELLFPFPGLEKDRLLRPSVFFDAGSLWGLKEHGDLKDELRTSAGVALSWISPVGPFKFSYAFPLRRKGIDSVERFSFTFGTTF